MRAALAGLSRGLLAGALLGALEFVLVVGYARELFLSPVELARYLALALSALPALCGLLVLLGGGVAALLARGGGEPRLRSVRLLVFALAAPLSGWVLWLLTAGRRARALPGRELLVALAALGAAALAAGLAALLVRERLRSRDGRAVAALLLGVAAVALVVDALVLRRLYPPFHLALSALAVLLAGCAAPFLPPPRWPRSARGVAALAGACALLALLGLRSLAGAPNARFAIRESAPLSGKLLRLFRPPLPPPRASARAAPSKSQLGAEPAGLDLRGRDVLLVTVDALRADRLRAYGGSGLTPAMDALAAQSVVFRRAYTPTPHTSYAIASLLTAKFMQPLLSLAETADDHATLPELLRHNGYRTAAFYPPAIFFVDEERFEWLRRDQLGFEYVKAMFASADARVGQLESYLAEAAPGHPLFVWVHLFEPHEPYDPPPAFARGDTPLLRYEGEVAAADASVGKLIERFRAARPGAVVILTADHGEEFGDHGGHHHGTTLFDEQVRVPVLWSSPGQAPPRVVDAPIEILDLTTSLLSALGIPREARMRGDDLGPLLAGGSDPPGLHAFATIEGARMVTDGRFKLICGESECQLFDLETDPQERLDLAQDTPERVAALRAELAGFAAALPKLEALAMPGGGAWPQALTRARLGDASAAAELLPLLSAGRAELRAAVACALGELGAGMARTVLSRMRTEDGDSDVRAESAVAALRLGELAAQEQVAALLPPQAPAGKPNELLRRAALALAGTADRRGEPILIAAAGDRGLDERDRLSAIRALGKIGGRGASEALLQLLAEVRLRPEVAAAVAAAGDRRAARALALALHDERYPEARRAEASALLALGARSQALPLIRRFLGTESSLPDGVGLLLQAGALAAASGAGAELGAAPHVRRGEWQCEARGCRPLAAAAIVLPVRGAPPGPARAIVRAQVEGTSRLLRLSGRVHYLNPGANEIDLALEHARRLVIEIESDPGVWLQAIAVVPATEDIPPPPPEPQPLAEQR